MNEKKLQWISEQLAKNDLRKQQIIATYNKLIGEKQKKYVEIGEELKKNTNDMQGCVNQQNDLKRRSVTSSQSRSDSSSISVLNSLVIKDFYTFYYTFQDKTVIIDIIYSRIQKGTSIYLRTQATFNRQKRITRLPEGMYPLVHKKPETYSIYIDFENHRFTMHIPIDSTSSVVYRIIRRSLLADEYIQEGDVLELYFNGKLITNIVILQSIGIRSGSTIQVNIIRKEIIPYRTATVYLEDSLQRQSFIQGLKSEKYIDVKRLKLLAGSFLGVR